MLQCEKNKTSKLDTCIASIGILVGVFYLQFQGIGLYWQYYSLPLTFAMLLKRDVAFSGLDVILLIFSLLMFQYFLLTENRFYINISIGTYISIIFSKLDLDYRKIFKLLFFLLIINLILIIVTSILDGDERLSSDNYWIIYTFVFDNLNKNYQVNNSAFFFLCVYFFYYVDNNRGKWFLILMIILHTSRIALLPIIILEFLKFNKNLVLIVLIAIILGLVFGLEYIDYYFIRIDESLLDRLDRLIKFTNKSFFENWLIIPKNEAEYSLHNWFVETIYYCGIFGFVYFFAQIYCSNKKIILILFIFACSGPKTSQDLLLYYIMIGFFLATNSFKPFIRVKSGFL